MPLTYETVKNELEGLAWLTECTLATVADMVMKQSPPTGELRRQISIAQGGINLIKRYRPRALRYPHFKPENRVKTVLETHQDSVVDYALALRARFHPDHPIRMG